jgi:hypothetical protein
MNGPDLSSEPQRNSQPVDINDLLNPSSPTVPLQLYHNPAESPSGPRLVIKLPPMTSNGPITGLRRSGRHRTESQSAGPSGSEYHESDKSVDMQQADGVVEEEPESPKVEYRLTSRGRKVPKQTYIEETSEEDPTAEELFNDEQPAKRKAPRHSYDEDDEDEDDVRRYPRRNTRSKSQLGNFIVSDEEGKPAFGRYSMRSRAKKPARPTGTATQRNGPQRHSGTSQRTRRLTRRNAVRQQDDGDVYVDQPSSGASADADGSFDDAPHTSSDVDPDPEEDLDADGDADADGEVDLEPEDGRKYALRQRAKINYAIPPPLEEMSKPPPKPARGGGKHGLGGGGGGARGGARSRGPGWSATGAELGRWMGMGGDDSVCGPTLVVGCR